MKKIIFAILATGLCIPYANAQNNPVRTGATANDSISLKYEKQRKDYALEDLEKEKERIEKQEKFKLKQALNRINDRLEKKEISVADAQNLKEDAAKEAALNIDNKLAIVENQKQLLERGSRWTFEYDGSESLELGIGNAYDDNGSTLLGFRYENRRKKVKYDKRTYTDIVIAGGINNTISDGHSLKSSPYKIWKSGFSEIGFTFRTRLLKDSNFWRLAYGASLDIHAFTLTGNRYLTVDGDDTNFETFPEHLRYQKFSITNLVFPVYLEFGNSKKIEYYDKMRYSTIDNWKFGIGGYAGMNLWQNQTLKYNEDGRKIQDIQRRSFNASNFVCGIGAYIGYGPTALYAKYEISPLFKNGPTNDNVLSLGLRIDL